ncbi:MAG: PTO1314 family radical SAM protein [Thermoplasmataceae archaeon]
MGLFSSVVLRSARRALKYHSGHRVPVIAGHKLLYTCNLRCKMCPFWRREDEALLSLDEERVMMESVASLGTSFMGFEGGEPLLRRDIDGILKISHSMFHTSLVTNGWFLKEKIRDIHNYLDFLFVSIDGLGETHDRQRGIPGSFKRAIEGVREAKKYLPVALSTTITSENMGEIKQVISLAEDIGVSVNLQVAFDYSTAEKMSPQKIQLKKLLEDLLEMKKNGSPIIESKEYFTSVLNSWFGGEQWRCKPWLTINIDPQGRVVLPCYVLNEYTGSKKIWEMDLQKVWDEVNWSEYETCNKCALSCYLEPSLFSWGNPGMVKERIIDSIVSYIRSPA